ncbi:hypothetical protein ACQY0O_007944 [Thecaphora frezii]
MPSAHNTLASSHPRLYPHPHHPPAPAQPSQHAQPAQDAQDGDDLDHLQTLARLAFDRLLLRLGSHHRRTALDHARQALHNLRHAQPPAPSWAATLHLALATLQRGPNDSRRLVLQCLCECFSPRHDPADGPVHHPVSHQQHSSLTIALLQCVNTCLRKSATAPRTASVSQLSASALRTAALALKALHSQLSCQSSSTEQPEHPSLDKLVDVASLMDTLLASIYIGLDDGASISQPTSRSLGRAVPSVPRMGRSALRTGALSFDADTSKEAASSGSKQHKRLSSSSAVKEGVTSLPVEGCDTDTSASGALSGSEAESLAAGRFIDSGSEVSTTTHSSPPRTGAAGAEEERKRASAVYAVRQNSLHCLIALNRIAPRALYTYWPSLFPDGTELRPRSASAAATALPATLTRSQAGVTSRLSSSFAAAGQVSLFTIVRREGPLAVRVAAVDALSALLGGGRAYLSIAQQRSGRLPAFTSLSAKLAALILDLRAELLHSLQDAALGLSVHLGTTPSLVPQGTRSEPASAVELTLALLRLTKTFATATSQARLLVSNLEVLQAAVYRLCSHADPSVTSLAYEAMAALASHSPSPTSARGESRPETRPLADSAKVASGLITKIEAAETRGESTTQPWRTLALYVGPQIKHVARADIVRSVALCEQRLDQSAADLLAGASDRQVMAEFVVALLTGMLSLPVAEKEALLLELRSVASSTTPPQPSGNRVRALLASMANDPNATVRKLVAGALPAWILLRHGSASLDAEAEDRLDLNLLDTLVRDAEEAVRAESIRAIGHMLTAKWQPPQRLKSDDSSDRDSGSWDEMGSRLGDQPTMRDSLLWRMDGTGLYLLESSRLGLREALADRSTAVRQQATWTLANWVEALLLENEERPTDATPAVHQCSDALWIALARTVLGLPRDDAAVAVGLLRAGGCLLALQGCSSAGQMKIDEDAERLTLELLDMICSVLEPMRNGATSTSKPPSSARSPKVRWNAANALERAVKNRRLIQWLCNTHDDGLTRMLRALGDGLGCKIFKVKIASAEALLSLRGGSTGGIDATAVADEQDDLLSPLRSEDVATVRTRIGAASERLEEEIERAAFKEASLYAQECRRLLDRLVQSYGLARW